MAQILKSRMTSCTSTLRAGAAGAVAAATIARGRMRRSPRRRSRAVIAVLQSWLAQQKD